MGGGAESCNTALAEIHVNGIIEDGSGGVADDGGEEGEGYDCVAEVVVCFELFQCCSVVRTSYRPMRRLTRLTYIWNQCLYEMLARSIIRILKNELTP